MTDLRSALHDYLTIRRQLGYELKDAGQLLEDYVAFMEHAGARRITTELALAWAKLPVDAHPHRWRRRLGYVRGFATWQRSTPSPRSRPKTCCPPLARAWRRTCTRKRRSKR
jgi:integrase/recombinase XerD